MCVGKVPGGWCTPTDPYVGFEGAFKCLKESGDIAFLKHTTVFEMVASKEFKSTSPDEFELLCKNGQRMPVTKYLDCNWGLVPSNAIVTSSARTPEQRRKYQKFLKAAMKMYSHKTSSNSTFSMNTNDNDRFSGRFNSDERFPNQPQRQPQRFNPNDRFNNDRSGVRSPFGLSSTTENPLNDSQPYESFEMFESNRYGMRLNLMFQVS